MVNTNLATALVSMLEHAPGVSVGKHLHHTNFLVGNKVFALIQGDGVVIKLPKAAIAFVSSQA